MKKHTFTLRIPEVLFCKLQALSEREYLSINSFIVLTLKDRIKDSERDCISAIKAFIPGDLDTDIE